MQMVIVPISNDGFICGLVVKMSVATVILVIVMNLVIVVVDTHRQPSAYLRVL